MKYNFSFYDWVFEDYRKKEIGIRRKKVFDRNGGVTQCARCAHPSTLMVCHCLLNTDIHVVSLERKLWKWFFFVNFLRHCSLNRSVYGVVMSKRSQLDYCYRFIIKIEPTEKNRTPCIRSIRLYCSMFVYILFHENQMFEFEKICAFEMKWKKN